MPSAAAVQLRLGTKDPREAVAECIDLIRKGTVSLEGAQINLGLHCGANCGVLIALAERLPSAALGFRSAGSDRALTASQFLTVRADGLSTFNGILTEHLLPTDALALVEGLLQSPAQSIRSTAFHLNVQNICWKGAPPEGTGDLCLFDLKAFHRAERFSLSASLLVPFENPKSVEVKNALNHVAQATGIPFNKAKISHVLGEKGRSLAHGQALLVGQVCFEEAIETLADRLTENWVAKFAPNALPPSDAFAKRIQKWGTTSNQKINLPSLLKNAVKQSLPAFKFVEAQGDTICFSKPIHPGAEALLLFEKQLPRLGKAFTVAMGVRSLADQMDFSENVFQFERTTAHRTWIYADQLEAEVAAKESVRLVSELLPHYESSLRRYFEPWPKEIPAGMEQLGQLTARQAFAKAEKLALSHVSDAILIRLSNHARSLACRDIIGPELSLDGRLVPNAAWWFHFYSAASDVSFQVTVPALGHIRILDHGKRYQEPNMRDILVPVSGNWMDSDRAFALAEERGGRERRSSGRVFGLLAKMQMSPSQQAYWTFVYLIVDQKGRNDLTVNLDAITGETLTEIRGF